VAVETFPTVEPGETVTATVTGQLVGEHTFGPPELTVRGAGGLFTETYARGPTCELVVEAREPGRIHIGTGGDAASSTFGAHTAGSGASGLVPAELREYVAGDPAARIDWNATARLARPHVREFDTDAELTTLFIIDRRERLDLGPPGETAFETLRASALHYLAITESLEDPVQCFGVTDTEIERLAGDTDGTRTYETLRRRIRGLTVDDASGATGSPERPQTLAQRSPTLDPTTPFGRTLRPYLRGGTAVRTADPLAAAVRNGVTTQRHGTQLALFTDDSDRAEIRNAVTEARRRNGRVAVFLAPRVLYEPGELDDPTATERYRSFEEFRQLLHSIPDVTAYEVAPQARIDRLLETTARVQQQTNT
jgi:uncharacterized protein (DUF58 family)